MSPAAKEQTRVIPNATLTAIVFHITVSIRMMSLLGLLGRHPNQIYVVFVCLGAYASFAEDPFLCTEWLEADQNVLEALF